MTDESDSVADWLQSAVRPIPIHATRVVHPAKLYRVGRCLECRTVFWFELVEPGKDRK